MMMKTIVAAQRGTPQVMELYHSRTVLRAKSAALSLALALIAAMVVLAAALPMPSVQAQGRASPFAALADLAHRYVLFVDGINTESSGDNLLTEFGPIQQALRDRGFGPNNFAFFSYSAANQYPNRSIYCQGWLSNCGPGGNLNTFWSPSYTQTDTHLPIAAQTDVLDWLIGQIVLKDPLAQVDLVGFSLGGIVSSNWGALHSTTSTLGKHVHGIVLIESPVGGIPMAGAVLSGCAIDLEYAACSAWSDALEGFFGRTVLRELQFPIGDSYGSIIGGLPDAGSHFKVTSVQSTADYLVSDRSIQLTNGADMLVGRGSQYWTTPQTLHFDRSLGGNLATVPLGIVPAKDLIGTNHGAPLYSNTTADWVIDALQLTDSPAAPWPVLASSPSISPNPATMGAEVDIRYQVQNAGGEALPLTEVYVDGNGPDGYWKAWACGGPNGQPPCSALDAGQTADFTSVLGSAGWPGDWSIAQVVAYYDRGPYTILGTDVGSFSVVESLPAVACTGPDGWSIGSLVGLRRGAEVWQGEGRQGSLFVLPDSFPEPYAVKVIDGPRCVGDEVWVDISRPAAGDPTGGTGWVIPAQAGYVGSPGAVNNGVFLSVDSSSASIGTAVTVHASAADVSYNTVRVTTPCGSPHENELGAPEMSFTWSTDGCSSPGQVTLVGQARRPDDPGWSNMLSGSIPFTLTLDQRPAPETTRPDIPTLIRCGPGFTFSSCYANGEYGDGGNDAAWRGADGTLDTQWSSLEREKSYWQATFQQPVTVAQVTIWGRGDGDTLAGRLEFSDGSSVDTGGLESNGCAHTVSFSPRTATFVRWQVTGMGNRNTTGFRDIEAYQTAAYKDGGSCGRMPTSNAYVPPLSGVDFVFGPEVPQGLQQRLRTALDQAVDMWQARLNVRPARIRLNVYGNKELMAKDWQAESGQTLIPWALDSGQHHCQPCGGVVAPGEIWLFGESARDFEDRSNATSVGPVTTFDHWTWYLGFSYFEMFRQEAVRLGGAAPPAPSEGLEWIDQGSGNYFAAQLLGALGRTSGYLPSIRMAASEQAHQLGAAGLHPQIREGLGSWLAVEMLVNRSGITALGDYYRAIGSGQKQTAAFLAAFGETPEAFYAQFDAAPRK